MKRKEAKVILRLPEDATLSETIGASVCAMSLREEGLARELYSKGDTNISCWTTNAGTTIAYLWRRKDAAE